MTRSSSASCVGWPIASSSRCVAGSGCGGCTPRPRCSGAGSRRQRSARPSSSVADAVHEAHEAWQVAAYPSGLFPAILRVVALLAWADEQAGDYIDPRLWRQSRGMARQPPSPRRTRPRPAGAREGRRVLGRAAPSPRRARPRSRGTTRVAPPVDVTPDPSESRRVDLHVGRLDDAPQLGSRLRHRDPARRPAVISAMTRHGTVEADAHAIGEHIEVRRPCRASDCAGCPAVRPGTARRRAGSPPRRRHRPGRVSPVSSVAAGASEIAPRVATPR